MSPSPLMRDAPMCLRIARLEQDILDGDKIAVVYASDLRALIAEYERLSSRETRLRIDIRDPDPSRPGIFRDHNCWKCRDGAKPCVAGNPRQCEYPRARND